MMYIRKALQNYKLYLLLFLFIVLSHLPVSLIIVKPALTLATIFFFSIFPQTRPNSFVLILLGLVNDFLGSELIAISSLNYILVAFLVSSNTHALMQQRFNIVWMAFIACLAIIYLVDGLLLSFFSKGNYFTLSMLVEYLATVFLYPLVHWFYFRNFSRFKA